MARKHDDSERRGCERANANFVISYKIKEGDNEQDLSQSKNVSKGGMLLTTNREFNKGTRLSMTIRFPFLTHKVEVEGEVVDSKEVVRHIIYETRIRFFGLEEAMLAELSDFVARRLKYQK